MSNDLPTMHYVRLELESLNKKREKDGKPKIEILAGPQHSRRLGINGRELTARLTPKQLDLILEFMNKVY